MFSAGVNSYVPSGIFGRLGCVPDVSATEHASVLLCVLPSTASAAGRHARCAGEGGTETHLSLSGGSSFFLQLASIDCIVLFRHQARKTRSAVTERGKRGKCDEQEKALDVQDRGPACAFTR